MPSHTAYWANLFQPTKTYVAKGLPMTHTNEDVAREALIEQELSNADK